MKLFMGMTAQLLAGEYTGTQFMKELGNLVVVIVSIAGALMTLYAVYIGYLFASASDANKRKAAKTRLIKVIASSLIIVGLASVLSVINVNFNKVEGKIDNDSDTKVLFTYEGTENISFSYDSANKKATGSCSFYTTNLRIDGKPIKEGSMVIYGCEFASSYKKLNNPSVSWVPSTSSTMTFVFSINSTSGNVYYKDGTVLIYVDKSEGPGKEKIPVKLTVGYTSATANQTSNPELAMALRYDVFVDVYVKKDNNNIILLEPSL